MSKKTANVTKKYEMLRNNGKALEKLLVKVYHNIKFILIKLLKLLKMLKQIKHINQ